MTSESNLKLHKHTSHVPSNLHYSLMKPYELKPIDNTKFRLFWIPGYLLKKVAVHSFMSAIGAAQSIPSMTAAAKHKGNEKNVLRIHHRRGSLQEDVSTADTSTAESARLPLGSLLPSKRRYTRKHQNEVKITANAEVNDHPPQVWPFAPVILS